MPAKKQLQLLQLEELRDIRPENPTWLDMYIRVFLGLSIPKQKICENHNSPFEYICGEFFDGPTEAWSEEEIKRWKTFRDVIVWACRGGQKTLSAGILSILDCKFKAGCEVRALGGSLDQSNKIYGYFVDMISKIAGGEVVGEPTKTQTQFANGSVMEILTQSEKSVRGVHVPKIRCDEVEEFKEEVWRPVQLVTSSMPGVKSSFEVLSTVHKPYGRMMELIDTAEEHDRLVLKWCLWEVIEGCPANRDCRKCREVYSYDESGSPHSFWEVCQGKAKLVNELRLPCITVEDAHLMFKRSVFEDFNAEMLCNRPTAGAGKLYKTYDDTYPSGKHIIDDCYDPELPLYISCDGGFHHPVVLLVQDRPNGQIIVIDEYRPEEVPPSNVVSGFWDMVAQKKYKQPTRAWCDPKAPDLMREFLIADKRGYPKLIVKPSDNDKVEGSSAIRSALNYSEEIKDTRLKICQRCEVLRREMRELHFPNVAASREAAEWHVKKDDHGPDALRYIVLELTKRVSVKIRTL